MSITEILGLIGITLIISSGKNTDFIRKKIKYESEKAFNIINCSMGVGFIIGILWTLIYYPNKEVLYKLFINGGCISIGSYIIDCILQKLEVEIFLKSGAMPKRVSNGMLSEDNIADHIPKGT